MAGSLYVKIQRNVKNWPSHTGHESFLEAWKTFRIVYFLGEYKTTLVENSRSKRSPPPTALPQKKEMGAIL